MNNKLIEYEKYIKSLNFEDLIREYNNACDSVDYAYENIFDFCAENGLPWSECCKRYENCIEYKMYTIARNEYETKATPELCKKNDLIDMNIKDIYGDKLTIAEFESSCRCNALTSDDGFGHYADDEYEYNICVNCSNGALGKSNKNFKYVIWYNK